MRLTATKARPALARAGSSMHACSSSRAASFLASSDVFDNSGRLIFEGDPAPNSTPSISRRYYPSHFCPPPDQSDAPIVVTSGAPAMHTHHADHESYLHTAQARQMSTLASHHAAFHGSTIMLDGPARPRHPPRIASRQNHPRAASTSAALNALEGADMKNHVAPSPLPEPIIYDGPARPPRKVSVQLRRTPDNTNGPSSSVVGTVVALAGLGAAYELYDANQNPQSTPKNILSYSRSRGNAASRDT